MAAGNPERTNAKVMPMTALRLSTLNLSTVKETITSRIEIADVQAAIAMRRKNAADIIAPAGRE